MASPARGSRPVDQAIRPAGRPKGGGGLAEYLRQQTDDYREMADIALQIERDPEVPPDIRLQALTWIADRGLGRPLQEQQVDVKGQVLVIPWLPAGSDSPSIDSPSVRILPPPEDEQ